MRRAINACLAVAALLGCNAILGIESGEVDPNGTLVDGGTPIDATTSLPERDSDAPGRDDDGGGPVDPGPPDAGPCVDLQTNRRHCGKCDHDCGPGTCSSGRCLAGAIVEDADTPGAFVVTSTDVIYLTQKGNLRRAPIHGTTTPETLFSTNVTGALGVSLVTIGDHVYFADRPGTRVARCRITGACAPETIVNAFDQPHTLATANGDLYIANGPPGTRIIRCAAPPCTQTNVVALDFGIRHLAAGPAGVVWSTFDNGHAGIRTKAGPTVPTVKLLDQDDAGAGPTALTADGRRAYAVVQGDLVSFNLDSPPGQALLGKIGAADSLTLEGIDVWYTAGDVYSRQRLLAPTAASTLEVDTDDARHVVVDPTGIYWISRQRLMHLAN